MEHPIEQLEGGSEELYKMEGFYRKNSGARELLSKEKKGLFLNQYIFSSGEERVEDFYGVDCLLVLPMKVGEGLCNITLLVLGQKISYWLIKIMFLEEVETTIKLGIKCRFGIQGF